MARNLRVSDMSPVDVIRITPRAPLPPRRESRVFIKTLPPSPRLFFTQGR